MLTIKELLTEISDVIIDADPRRPDYRTDVELEMLEEWREIITAIERISQRETLDLTIERDEAADKEGDAIDKAYETHVQRGLRGLDDGYRIPGAADA